MSFDQTEWLWMNGEMIRWRDACVHLTTHTLHLGSGVFEALRCYPTDDGPAIFRLDAHVGRLFASAAMYEMEIGYSTEELQEAICETIRRNRFNVCYIRLLCYLGSGSLGVFPRDCPVQVAVIAWPLGAYLGARSLESGVRATISSWTKFHSRMMPTTAKACGQYLNSILALREAIRKGYDEAILLDLEGNVAEGSGENIFLVRDGRLLTNDEQSSILLGITRQAVIEIAHDLGYPVEIGKMSPADLLSADEAFFTGTAAEVTPIREVDGQPIGRQARGPITEKIQQTFFNATTGGEPKYRRWLHFVGQPATAIALSVRGPGESLNDSSPLERVPAPSRVDSRSLNSSGSLIRQSSKERKCLMRNESIVELYRAVDSSDWDGLMRSFHADIVYERPGYQPFSGIDRVLQFYQKERVLASGQHHLEQMVLDEEKGACWGRFIGFKKDGSPVDELFADVYTFEGGKIRTRRSYFFRPAV
jgi:branched-chain amino acid aminotransferase